MGKRATDEIIISAVLSHGTIKKAAEAAGVSERTIYNRMSDGEFIEKYSAAKAEIMRAAVLEIHGHMRDAINTIAEIMNDPDTNAAVRLQAAQAILTQAGKFADRLQGEETRTAEQAAINEMTRDYRQQLKKR